MAGRGIQIVSVTLGMSWAWSAAAATGELHFARDVLPILSEKCFACHGPDADGRKKHGSDKFRLDSFEGATVAIQDRHPVVPGQPERSEVIRRIRDAEDPMPPPESGKTVSDAELAVLRRWIAAGATYERHWAFQPLPDRMAAPAVRRADWPRDDLDRFVLARLEQEGLPPSAEAAKARWLRRVSLDLTGIAPTPAEVRAFLADAGTNAAALVVDRLLASPRFGEHFAVPWLDSVRYADSYGYQADYLMHAWPYRDWVVRALNENLPYDQFLVKQLAGDLLPDATRDDRLATAVHRIHRLTNEGGSVPEEFRTEGVADRVQTFGTAMLGLTLECARCHDHRYDPITARDYYQLAAHFNSIDELGLYPYFTSAVPPPSLDLPTPEQSNRLAAAQAAVAKAEAAYANERTAAEERFKAWRDAPAAPQPVAHFPFDAVAGGKSADTSGQHNASVPGSAKAVEGRLGGALQLDGDDAVGLGGLGAVDRWDPFSVSCWVHVPTGLPRVVLVHRSKAWLDACGQGWEVTIEEGRLRFLLCHFWPGDAASIRTRADFPRGRWVQITATHDGSGRAGGMQLYVDGVPADTEVERDHLTRTIAGGGGSLELGARFRDNGLAGGRVDDVRLFDRALSALDVAHVFGTPVANPDEAQRKAHYLAAVDAPLAAARAALRTARAEAGRAKDAITAIMTMEDQPAPRETWVLHRGEYTAPRTPENVVARGAIDYLGPWPAGAPSNRLGLARWVTDPKHPLTARVAVNRIWQTIWGRGLVELSENFGLQSGYPAQRELLDYLAVEFVRGGWDTKRLARRIVLSATYRQDSARRADLAQRDPRNDLLARGPAQRLSAEQLRDSALAASGLLVDRVGGPPAHPYQPDGLWKENNTFSPAYPQGKGEELYRRTLYTVRKRTAPEPVSGLFDAPSRELCVARRQTTSTPLQSLALLNQVQYLEAQRVLAQALLAQAGDDAARLEQLQLALVGRPATAGEQSLLRAALDEQRKIYAADPALAAALLKNGEAPAAAGANPAEVAAWTAVAQLVMNSDGFVWKR